MLTVKDCVLHGGENIGCNNGNLQNYTLYFEEGGTFSGTTCRCGNGCHGADRVPEMGMKFQTMEDLKNYIWGEDEEVSYEEK